MDTFSLAGSLTGIRRFCKAALLICAPALLAACGSSERATDVAAEEGVLMIGIGSEPKTIDPGLATGTPESRVLYALMEGLIGQDPKDDLVNQPGVAERWESNEDFTVWTFHLRENAKWSNGDPLTAEDFAYAWKRTLTPELGAEFAEMLFVIKNAEPYQKGEITDWSQVGVKVLDPYTLQVTLEGPTPHFLGMTKHYTYFPVDAKVVEANGGAADRQSRWSTAENFVGNGPFVIKRWAISEVMETVKNPNYWDADNVKLNGVNFYPVENISAEETMFRGGRLHITYEVPSSKLPILKTKFKDELQIDKYLGSYFYRVNTTKPPFDDPRVRKAFAMAIDKQLLVDKVTQGGQQPATGYVPPGISGYEASTAVPYDVEAARRLLAEAGYPDGKGFPTREILINTSENHRRVAEAIQAMWKKNLNVEVGIYNQEWKVYLNSQINLDYDVSRSGWIADYVYPSAFLNIFTTGGGNNNTGWGNPQYDRLIDASRTAQTEEQRMGLMHDAEEILLNELPIIPIYWYTRVYLKDPRVKGWYPKLLDRHPYKYIYFDNSGTAAADEVNGEGA